MLLDIHLWIAQLEERPAIIRKPIKIVKKIDFKKEITFMIYNRKKVEQILLDICDTNCEKSMELRDDSRLLDYGMDSLKFISFIVAIEDEFSIQIQDSDLLFEKYETIQKLHGTLSKYFQNDCSLKKCLIIDCDNVLWRGISGEEPITIDDDILKLHLLLTDLYSKGILLCLCTRNTEFEIRKAFSEVKLSQDIFTIMNFDSKNKALCVSEISSELNLSIDDMVFADDSSYEVGYVSGMHPSLHTIHATSTKLLIDEVQKAFSETPSSDIDRTKLYKEQKNRTRLRGQFNSILEYNIYLKTQFHCQKADIDSLPRLAELSQRTHQFNLSDAHYSVEELNRLFHCKNITILQLSATDIYGDMGIVGMAVIQGKTINAFIISCRVFDRNFEYVLLDSISKLSPRPTHGIYVDNIKNRKFSDFFSQNGITTK